MSGWTVREATSAERDELARTEERLFPAGAAPDPTWLLDRNPAGPGTAFVAVGPNGELGGTRALFPWRLTVDGREVTAGQAGRAWTAPEFRGRGLSVLIGRRLREAAAERGMPFLFSFPSAAAQPGHRRLGHALVPVFRRRQAILSPRAVARALPGILDLPVAAGRRLLVRRGGRRWERASDPAAEAERLWPELAGEPGVHGVRDAAFVSWRYLGDSGRAYALWCYPAGDAVRLLAAVRLLGKRARVVDLWGRCDRSEAPGALAALVDALARDGAWLVDWSEPLHGFWSGVGARAGFLPRRQKTWMARWTEASEGGPEALRTPQAFALTEGDTDYA
jgi:hypothetical protein